MKLKNFKMLSALIVGCALIPAASFASGGNGLTWTKSSHDTTLGTDRVSCAGCDPYVGDTSCETALPLLCINFDNAPNPGIATNFYNGWTGGHIALTTPIRGDKLISSTHADYVCFLTFGDGYQMASHDDGNGGWNWNAYGNVDDASRFWLRIDTQPGNCWD